MSSAALVMWIVIGLILAKTAAQLILNSLNRKHIMAHSGNVPEAFKQVVDEQTYAKSIRYSLAKGSLDRLETIYEAIVLLIVLFSGALPWGYGLFTHRIGHSAWAGAGFLITTMVALSLTGLPLSWYYQFRLEEKFGFNTTTQKIWWFDRLKGLLLALVLGLPLCALVLKLVEWTGEGWWIWAWATLLGFQLVMSVLAPVLILPLFNKFTPLPKGGLRERLLSLAGRTHFRARSIQVMDGSKRSRHSNAFFIGFGKFRKIVLFDTLIQQLGESEIEAVLAHEIGHFRKKHILQTLLLSMLGSLGGLYVLSLLAKADWFSGAFGFAKGNIATVLLLFSLLSGLVTFWFSPLAHWWSRRHEYEADAFAADAMTEPWPLVGALRKLNEKNLSNLMPHPAYSRFYYSHPTLLERESALTALAKA